MLKQQLEAVLVYFLLWQRDPMVCKGWVVIVCSALSHDRFVLLTQHKQCEKKKRRKRRRQGKDKGKGKGKAKTKAKAKEKKHPCLKQGSSPALPTTAMVHRVSWATVHSATWEQTGIDPVSSFSSSSH